MTVNQRMFGYTSRLFVDGQMGRCNRHVCYDTPALWLYHSQGFVPLQSTFDCACIVTVVWDRRLRVKKSQRGRRRAKCGAWRKFSHI